MNSSDCHINAYNPLCVIAKQTFNSRWYTLSTKFIHAGIRFTTWVDQLTDRRIKLLVHVSFPLFCDLATEATVMVHLIKTSDFSGDGGSRWIGMKEPACIHIKAGLKGESKPPDWFSVLRLLTNQQPALSMKQCCLIKLLWFNLIRLIKLLWFRAA